MQICFKSINSSFKQFVANLEEETGYEKNNDIEEHASGLSPAIDSSEDEISLMVKDMLDSSDRAFKSKALDRYRSIGEQFYQEACKMDEKVKRFEAKIQRWYFDATPLDNDQLNNWHLYLDFIETENNMDWVKIFVPPLLFGQLSWFHLDIYHSIFYYYMYAQAMKLYERCLIPCAT